MKPITLLLAFFLQVACVFGQIPDLIHQGIGSATTNPALIGWHGTAQIYTGAQSAFYTANHYLGSDMYIKQAKMGIGLSASSFRYGTGSFTSNSYSMTLNRRFQVGERLTLIPALTAEYHRENYEFGWICCFGICSEPYRPVPNSGGVGMPVREFQDFMNIGVGLGVVMGQTVLTINQRHASRFNALRSYFDEEVRLIPITTFQAFRSFLLHPKISVTPSVSFSNQGEFNWLSGSINMHMWNFHYGISGHSSNRIAYQFGYDIRKTVLISYAHGRTYSQLNYINPVPTHELVLRIQLNQKRREHRLLHEIPLL